MRNDLKNYAQNELRFRLAQEAHKISVFTKGIFMMEKTLMGVIEVDPKIVLEKGIRRELLQLVVKISSIKKSFLYIQDYININGSKMWCEEMHKIINYYVELEVNRFLARKIKQKNDFNDTMKESASPKFAPIKGAPESPTFLGRLTRYILNLTNPKNSIFCPAINSWYDKNNNEIFGIKLLNKIKFAMGIEGFQGFGKLLGYLNYHHLLTLQNIH